MRKLFVLLFLSPIMMYAQNSQDSTKTADSTPVQEEVKISLNDLTALNNAKEDAINEYNALERKYNAMKLHCDTVSADLLRLRAKHETLQKENSTYKKQLSKTDKVLVSTASNFLYIPYEAYSIEKIALRAFDAIYDDAMRQKHIIKYELLKNYQTDIKEMLAYLQRAKEKLSNPFELKGDGVSSLLRSLKQEPFYIEYHKYDDWENTYMGKKMISIENRLKNYSQSQAVSFDGMIKDLEECLKTVEDL